MISPNVRFQPVPIVLLLFLPEAAAGNTAAHDLLATLGDATFDEINALEQRSRALNAEKRLVQKEIKNKKGRDARLMKRAAKDLTTDQLIKIASLKASAKAKASPSREG